jgi:NACHT domain-containing protein
MRRKARVAGWRFVALAVLAIAAIVIVGTFRAHGDAAFNRWVGWATVAALAVAAIAVLPALRDMIAPDTATDQLKTGQVEDELAAAVLAQAQVARSRLIGAGEPGDRAANVRFVKGSGRFREVDGPSEGSLATVLEYYRSLSPGRLVLLGEPGAGKTVLMIELLIQLLEQHQHDPATPVAVLVSAAAYDTSLGWEQWLAGHLALRFGTSPAVAARLVRDGRLLPLVDGLDEMDLAASQPERAGVLVAALNGWMRGRERAPVVVTCRRDEYRALGRGIDRAAQVEMVPLSGAEIADYLREQFLDASEEHRWEPVLTALRADPAGPLVAQLATPWRLTLALTAFRDDGDPADLLPATPDMTAEIAAEYARGVDRQLLNRYVPAAVGLHDPSGRYRPDDVERWLTALADGLAWQASHELSATDIRLDQWWKPTGRRATRLGHTTVVALAAVPWFIAEVATGTWGFFVPGALVLAGALATRRTVAARRIRIGNVLTRRGLRDVAIGLAFATAFDLALWITSQLVESSSSGIPELSPIWFVAPLVPVFAIGLAVGLARGITDTSPRAVKPHDVISSDGRYGLAVGLAYILVIGFAMELVGAAWFGLGLGLAGALTIGVMVALLGGPVPVVSSGSAWVRYHVSVVINAVRRRGPLRFAAFLDWAHQAGLLRVSGVAYQFRHRQLQDWLTPPHPPPHPHPDPVNYVIAFARACQLRN